MNIMNIVLKKNMAMSWCPDPLRFSVSALLGRQSEGSVKKVVQVPPGLAHGYHDGTMTWKLYGNWQLLNKVIQLAYQHLTRTRTLQRATDTSALTFALMIWKLACAGSAAESQRSLFQSFSIYQIAWNQPLQGANAIAQEVLWWCKPTAIAIDSPTILQS